MSVQMMGAVIHCGPHERTQFCVLLALANYADDFGFAYPSLATIAANSRCDERTARRQVVELEAGGWLYVARKVLNGKSNVYLLNTQKIGVSIPRDSRRNPLFIRLLKTHPDTMTPIFAPDRPAVAAATGPFFAPEESPDTETISEDNPQGVQRTSDESHRTNEGGSADIACPPNRYNHKTVLNRQGTIKGVEPDTPTPFRGEEEILESGDLPCETARDEKDLLKWGQLLSALKRDLASQPLHPNFSEIVRGSPDWESCFAWTHLGSHWITGRPPGPLTHTLRLGLPYDARDCDRDATRRGLAKYAKRLEALAREYFPIERAEAIRFELLPRDQANAIARMEHPCAS